VTSNVVITASNDSVEAGLTVEEIGAWSTRVDPDQIQLHEHLQDHNVDVETMSVL